MRRPPERATVAAGTPKHRRRRIALAAATLVGVAGLALTIALAAPRGAAPPPSAQHHRVALDVPPVDAALWFVARYPGYFKSGEQRLDEWLAGLDPREREFVLAMGQTLAWAWVEHELAAFDERQPAAIARQAIAVVRHKTLNQFELDIKRLGDMDGIELHAFVGDPYFADGVFARLVRGASNCDGQNHLLALLLEAALEPERVWQPRARVGLAGIPGHELVHVSGPLLARPMFVDAWSNLPPFTVDAANGEPVLAKLPGLTELAADGRRPAPVVPGLRGRAPAPAEHYAQTRGVVVPIHPGRFAPTVPVDLVIRPPKLDAASLARIRDPWRVFLFARVLHIYDDPRAAELYQFVLEHHCDGRRRRRTHVCAAAGVLIERVHTTG